MKNHELGTQNDRKWAYRLAGDNPKILLNLFGPSAQFGQLFAIFLKKIREKDLKLVTTITCSKLSIKRPVLLEDLVRKNQSYRFSSGLPRPIFGLY